jgi:Na+-transporting methylmalonyl-CoA/oxaloacetate decarboxylase gamma subunit
MKIINFIIDYWPILVILLSIFIYAIRIISDFLGKTKEERLENIKQWAIYACALA